VTDNRDPRTALIEAATWHGNLKRAEAILAAHPEIASCDIHTAAILGDDAAVRRFLAQDPGTRRQRAPLRLEPKAGQPFGPWMDMRGDLWESLPEGGWKKVERLRP